MGLSLRGREAQGAHCPTVLCQVAGAQTLTLSPPHSPWSAMVSQRFLFLQHGGRTPVSTVPPLPWLALSCWLCWFHAPCVLSRHTPAVGGPFDPLGVAQPPPSWAMGRGGSLGSVCDVGPHRPTLAPAQLTSFFGALESVLRYRATVVQAFKDMNRFTVNETVLSTKDVLILLHKWSLIERDARLQDDLRAAIEKYQVKELLSECRDPAVWRSPDCAQLPTEHPAVCLSEQHFRSCQGLGTGHTRPRSPAEVAGEAWL